MNSLKIQPTGFSNANQVHFKAGYNPKFTAEELEQRALAVENGDFEAALGDVPLPAHIVKSKNAKKIITYVASATTFAAAVLSFKRIAPVIRRSASKLCPDFLSKGAKAGAKELEKYQKAADSLANSGVLSDDLLALLGKFVGKDSDKLTLQAANRIIKGEMAPEVLDYLKLMSNKETNSVYRQIAQMAVEDSPVESIRILIGSLSEDSAKIANQFVDGIQKQSGDVKGFVARLVSGEEQGDLQKFFNVLVDKNTDKNVLDFISGAANACEKGSSKLKEHIAKLVGPQKADELTKVLSKFGINTGGDAADTAIAVGAAVLAGREAGDIAEGTQEQSLGVTMGNISKVVNSIPGFDIAG